MEVKNYFATDAQGNVLGSAQVYLYLAGTTTLATGLQSISGAALANPFTSQSNGLVQFRAPDNNYDLRVVKPGREFTIPIQCFDGVAFYGDIINSPYSPSKGLGLIPFRQPYSGAVNRTALDKMTDVVSVKDFGALGNGVFDDTQYIDKALDSVSQTAKCLFFPRGSYKYNGAGHPFSGTRLFIIGEGRESTQIIMGDNSRLIDTNTAKVALNISGLQFAGGLGAFRSRFSGVDVSYYKFVKDNIFINYSACAFEVNATDSPYWSVTGNVFRGINSTTTMGLALNRWSDKSIVSGNAFIKNRIHLKMRSAGQNVSVQKNDFIQFEKGDGTSRASVWLVPGDSVNDGHGCNINNNKFGLENLEPNDFRVLYAPEISAESNGLSMPNISQDSSEYVFGASITENTFLGSDRSSPSIVYSTTPNLRGSLIRDNQIQYNQPKMIIEYRTAPSASEAGSITNIIANNTSLNTGFSTRPNQLTNGVYSATLVDDAYLLAGVPENIYPHTSGANDRVGFVGLWTSRASGIPTAGGATTTALTDSTGETDARSVVMPNFSAVNCIIPTAGILPGKPGWIEFDLKSDGATPLQYITARITHSSGPNSFVRVVNLPNGWVRFRFPYVFRSASLTPTLQLINLSGASGTLAVGRIRVYHAREPVTFGRVVFEQMDLSSLPTSSSGLPSGSLWVDAAAGNTVKRVPNA